MTEIILDDEVVDVFATASNDAPKAKSDDKEKVLFPESKYPGFGEALTNLQTMLNDRDALDSDIEILAARVKESGLQVWFDKYVSQGSRPESFLMAGEDSDTELLLIVMDKYTTLKAVADAQSLIARFGKTVAYVEREYKVNQDMVRLYMSDIQNAINGLDIPKEDKDKMLVVSFDKEVLAKHLQSVGKAIGSIASIPAADRKKLLAIGKEKPGIAKGAINQLMAQPADKRREFLFSIQPQVQIKRRGSKE